MFCIASFIILGIISIFSASHRKLAKNAWHCVVRKASFRPCDTSFKEELKAKMLAKVILRRPKLAKYLDSAIEVLAVLFIMLTVWSLYVAVKSGLNLYVWGTCAPRNSSSCSLGAEACSIESLRPSFITSLETGTPQKWVQTEASDFAKTVENIPTRLRDWKAQDYLPANVSYLAPYNTSKPTALEIIDPGCQFCQQLFNNIKTSGFDKRYNLAYIAYPIPDPKEPGSYKFQSSYLMTSYLEGVRMTPLKNSSIPVDWKILERIFTQSDAQKVPYQIKINSLISTNATETLLQQWLKEFGYNDVQIAVIKQNAHSQKVKDIIEHNRLTVNNKIRTVKIPTIIYGGRRHDGVVTVDGLR
jgi:hypothetical protein